MRTRAAPFSEAPPAAVRFPVPWVVRTPSGDEPLGEDVRGWDFQSILHLGAVVAVDVTTVRSACHLGPGTHLVLVVTAASSNTKMRGPVARRIVEDGADMSLDVLLHGHELGGRLILDTLLVATSIDRADLLSPTVEASILWRHRKASWLEGDASRFPTEVADLSGPPFFAPRALWFLDLHPEDLDAAAMGAVRLVLNEGHPVVARILAGDSSPESAAAIGTLRWDITRQLVSVALTNEEFMERAGLFEEGTLGFMLAALISSHWPGESVGALRQRLFSERARFERELQDRSGLFDE